MLGMPLEDLPELEVTQSAFHEGHVLFIDELGVEPRAVMNAAMLSRA